MAVFRHIYTVSCNFDDLYHVNCLSMCKEIHISHLVALSGQCVIRRICDFSVHVGFGEGDRSMREDREDRDTYRRMEGRLCVVVPLMYMYL